MLEAGLLVRNIGQLVTVRGPDAPRTGSAMSGLGIVESGAVAALGGRIVAVGSESEVLDAVSVGSRTVELDAGGCVVTPGLVDAHTHAVFARTRESEFAMRVEGRSYEEIAEAGGGIRSSVRDVRSASEDELFARGALTLDRMMAFGTTTVEVKSGYGLSLDAELKMLRVIERLSELHALDIVPTFLGAHEVPDEYREDRDGYISELTRRMIPAVARAKLARFCDVFCERGVFSVEQSRMILRAAQEHGMSSKVHADELSAFGGAELAAEISAVSADHVVCSSDEGLKAMAESGVVAVLLPGTTLSLGKRDFARARFIIETGGAVALATDCNPGSSMTESMQMIISLASMVMRMLPEEALVAATINAACAVGMERSVGSLTVGKLCDLVLWDVDDYRAIPYHYGVNLAATVVKRGTVVSEPGHTV